MEKNEELKDQIAVNLKEKKKEKGEADSNVLLIDAMWIEEEVSLVYIV